MKPFHQLSEVIHGSRLLFSQPQPPLVPSHLTPLLVHWQHWDGMNAYVCVYLSIFLSIYMCVTKRYNRQFIMAICNNFFNWLMRTLYHYVYQYEVYLYKFSSSSCLKIINSCDWKSSLRIKLCSHLSMKGVVGNGCNEFTQVPLCNSQFIHLTWYLFFVNIIDSIFNIKYMCN